MHTNTRIAGWLVLSTASMLAGCGSDGSSSTAPAEGDSSDAGTPQTGNQPLAPLSAHAVCEMLLACATVHQQLGEYSPIYGTNGSCWKQSSETQCKQACMEAMQVFWQSGTPAHNLSCMYCEANQACKNLYHIDPNGVSLNACDPKQHACVECVNDQDCSDYAEVSPFCVNQRCVACRTVADCPPGGSMCGGKSVVYCASAGYCTESC